MRKIAYWLSLLMIFLIPWEGIVVLPDLGTASRLVGLMTLATWLLALIIGERVRKITPFHVFVFLFYGWNAITILWSLDVDATLARIFIYARMSGLVLLIWDLYDSPAAVRQGLQFYILGSFAPVISIIHNFITGNQISYGRYSAASDNANTTGIVIAFMIPVAWHLALSADPERKTRWLQLVNYAYIPTGLFAIALTGTRFAMIMTLPALVFGLGAFTQLKLGARIVIFLLLAVALTSLPTLLPESSLERLGSVRTEITQGDLSGRTILWQNGFDLWADEPLLGIGSAAFPQAVEPLYGRRRHLHNSYLAILAETGLIGFLLFGLLLTSAVAQIRYLPKWDRRFWITMLVVWGLGNLILTWEYTKSTWLLLTLLAAHTALSRRQGEVSTSMRALPQETAPVTPAFATVADAPKTKLKYRSV